MQLIFFLFDAVVWRITVFQDVVSDFAKAKREMIDTDQDRSFDIEVRQIQSFAFQIFIYPDIIFSKIDDPGIICSFQSHRQSLGGLETFMFIFTQEKP